MAAWPSSLPQFLEINSSDRRQRGFIRSQVDAGPAKQRRRFTAASRVLRGTMLLTNAQRSTFDTFYEDTLKEGSDEFTMTDPRDNTTQTFRFVEVPEFRMLVGGASGVAQQRVSLSLERLP